MYPLRHVFVCDNDHYYLDAQGEEHNDYSYEDENNGYHYGGDKKKDQTTEETNNIVLGSNQTIDRLDCRIPTIFAEHGSLQLTLVDDDNPHCTALEGSV